MDAATRERAWHFKQLRWSLEALAASASDQRPLFPERAVTADELALDFDHWHAVIRQHEDELSDPQRRCLEAIDEGLSRMSRDAADLDADLWSPEALQNSEAWESVRRLAREALHAFGWAMESPPVDSADQASPFVGS